MEEILAGHDRAVFICGIARNQEELLDLFDRVFLLRIDAQTQEARLDAHDARNPPGRSEAGRQEIREGRAVFEAQMLRHGAIAIDATAPPAAVADELLALVAATDAPDGGSASGPHQATVARSMMRRSSCAALMRPICSWWPLTTSGLGSAITIWYASYCAPSCGFAARPGSSRCT